MTPPYHGLPGETPPDEDVLSTILFMVNPPKVRFDQSIDRDQMVIMSDRYQLPYRLFILNPYWRPEVEQLGIQILEPTRPKPADTPTETPERRSPLSFLEPVVAWLSGVMSRARK